jgi:hypothetical protein
LTTVFARCRLIQAPKGVELVIAQGDNQFDILRAGRHRFRQPRSTTKDLLRQLQSWNLASSGKRKRTLSKISLKTLPLNHAGGLALPVAGVDDDGVGAPAAVAESMLATFQCRGNYRQISPDYPLRFRPFGEDQHVGRWPDAILYLRHRRPGGSAKSIIACRWKARKTLR